MLPVLCFAELSCNVQYAAGAHLCHFTGIIFAPPSYRFNHRRAANPHAMRLCRECDTEYSPYKSVACTLCLLSIMHSARCLEGARVCGILSLCHKNCAAIALSTRRVRHVIVQTKNTRKRRYGKRFSRRSGTEHVNNCLANTAFPWPWFSSYLSTITPSTTYDGLAGASLALVRCQDLVARSVWVCVSVTESPLLTGLAAASRVFLPCYIRHAMCRSCYPCLHTTHIHTHLNATTSRMFRSITSMAFGGVGETFTANAISRRRINNAHTTTTVV